MGLALALVLGFRVAPLAAQSCPGDRDGSGVVTVDEIVAAVDGALNGCDTEETGRFVDLGDGTVRDGFTGLVWEKKRGLDATVNAADSHDADNVYRFSGTCSGNGPRCQPTAEAAALCREQIDGDPIGCSVCESGVCEVQSPGVTVWQWLAELRRGKFAGQDDWRLPSRAELAALARIDTLSPSIAPAFHGAQCGAACSNLADPACACSAGEATWSSSTFVGNANRVWVVQFNGGGQSHENKGAANVVRAVR